MEAWNMPAWTIELDVPVFDLEPPPTRRVPNPAWFMEHTDAPELEFDEEVPTRVDGKIRVFGEPIELNRRGPGGSRRPTIPAPRHADGPGPSIHSVVTRYIGE